MTLRKWFHLFWTSLVIGAASALVIGVVLQAQDRNFAVMGLSGVGFNVFNMILAGFFLISVISQTAFFCLFDVSFYDDWHDQKQESLGIYPDCFDLHSSRVWPSRMAELCSYSCGYPYRFFRRRLLESEINELQRIYSHIVFFMSAVTVLEAIPSLRLNSVSSSLFMIVPLIFCNAWQILTLHKIVDSKKRARLSQLFSF